MKKSKLSVGLVTAFIGAMALSACNTGTPAVTSQKGVIADFVGYNEKTDRIEIKTGLYDEISDTDEGTKLYYNAVLETLIRSQYEQLSRDNPTTLKSYALLKSEAAGKTEAAKQTARDNASSSGTSYNEEWQKILDSYDCENEEDLTQYYLYDLEKQELTDWYTKNNVDDLKDQYIGVNASWEPVPETEKKENVDSVYPYHILHILVTLSADKSNYVRGTITESEAKNLWDVVRKLIDSTYDFQEIAMNKSDDTGSKDKYGDVEIMSTKTSFYNEFKLGVYAYDALLSGVNEMTAGSATEYENRNIYEALGLKKFDEGTSTYVDSEVVVKTTQDGEQTDTIENLINDEMINNINTPLDFGGKIPTIPYEVFKMIGDVAEEDKIGLTAPEAGDVALPRNILFNQFLNFHSPFVITDEDINIHAGTDEDTRFSDETATVSQHDFTTGISGEGVNNGLILAGTNFSEDAIPLASTSKRVLTDQDNNVIIGVRSEAGIHFMVMRKSIFPDTNVNVGRIGTSLQDYYTTFIPGEDEYPEGDPQTFVNMAKSEKSYYTKRADTIKNELKSTSTFDAAFDYRLYEFLMECVEGKIKFFDYNEETGTSKIQENIDEYIKLLRETKHNGDVESLNQAWQSYLMMLRDQNFKRNYKYSMLSTTCALKFNADNKDLFKEGGACYVEK